MEKHFKKETGRFLNCSKSKQKKRGGQGNSWTGQKRILLFIFYLRTGDMCSWLNAKWEFCGQNSQRTELLKVYHPGILSKVVSESIGLWWRPKQWCDDSQSLLISLVLILPLWQFQTSNMRSLSGAGKRCTQSGGEAVKAGSSTSKLLHF